MSDPRACRVLGCAKGSPGSMSEGLCRIVLLTVCALGLYEYEIMLAAYCDALRCLHYTPAAALAPHAMQCKLECNCVPETDGGCHVSHIKHDCAVSCLSLERLALTCHAP